MSAPRAGAALAGARALLRQGREDEAEAAIRGALEAAPGDPGLLQYLGLLRLKRGDKAEAEALLRRAVAHNPGAADCRVNLGNVLDARGQPAAAADCFRAALLMGQDNAAIHGNLGNALMKLGRVAEAVSAYAEAAALKPGEARHAHSLGAALIEAGRFAEAEAQLKKAVSLAPGLADAHLSLGLSLARQDRHEEAEACYRRALAIEPLHLRALVNLGGALLALRRHEEFAETQRRAIAIAPDYAEAHANLAAALLVLGRYAEAEAAARKALALKPALAEAVNTLAASIERQGRVDEAIQLLRREAAGGSVEGRAEAHFALALALLRHGRFAEGWREYEWRWGVRKHRDARRDFAKPQWRGGDVAGKTVLLHAEQGLGDAIQFLRYAPLLARRGARVVLEVPAALERLARGLPGVAEVVAAGAKPPGFDLHCPLLSLPLAFGTESESIPGLTPYLKADPAETALWRERLAAMKGKKKLGIVWAGNPGYASDRDRSINPMLLQPLLRLDGVAWCSLQVGPAADAIKAVDPAGRVAMPGGGFKDFAGTAACVAALDLVIAVDTAVAHLAGALNRPVWILLPFSADWRWLVGRDDSPWYPSATLFRQSKPGDWPWVIERIAGKLASYASMVNT